MKTIKNNLTISLEKLLWVEWCQISVRQSLFPASTGCPMLLLSLNCTVSALASEFQFVTPVTSGLVHPSLLIFTSSFCNSLLWQVYTWLVCTITQGDSRSLFDLTCSVVECWGGSHWKQTPVEYVGEGA